MGRLFRWQLPLPGQITYRNIRGICYWRDYLDARDYAKSRGLMSLPDVRFVAYDYGWTIQKHKSGPYWGPSGWV